MDRNEFVSTLRAALMGNVPPAVVEENVRYYDSYISQEIASGKSEREVLESMGDPRLIARTIIDTQGSGRQGEPYDAYESYGAGAYDADGQQERPRGFHAEFRDDGGVDIKYRRFNFNTWYGKLLIAAVVILVLALILVIVGGILSWVLPILIPVVLIVWLIRVLFGDR